MTVRVTVSLTCTSPPTVPVTATVPPASAALTMLSAVMASRVMLATGASVSTACTDRAAAVFGVTAASKATPAATPTARMPWKPAIGVTTSV